MGGAAFSGSTAIDGGPGASRAIEGGAGVFFAGVGAGGAGGLDCPAGLRATDGRASSGLRGSGSGLGVRATEDARGGSAAGREEPGGGLAGEEDPEELSVRFAAED